MSEEPRDRYFTAGGQLTAERYPPTVKRYAAFIKALYVLAFLHSGNRVMAETMVVSAVRANRTSPLDGPSGVWRRLASQMEGRRDRTTRSTPRPGGSSRLSPFQGEVLALVAGGWKAQEAAGLLEISAADVHRNVRAGMRAVYAAHAASLQPLGG